jgi:hypothetical protein
MTTREELLSQLRSSMVDWLYLRALQQYGRRVIYKPAGEWEGFALAFRPDGTGFAEDTGGPTPFVWRHEPVSADQLRALREDEMQAIAKQVFAEQIAARLRDPYIVDLSQFDEKIAFVTGSREELVQLTRWILQTAPELFASGGPVPIVYHARSDAEAGGLQARGTELPPRVQTLLDMAFEYNTFTGNSWEYDDRGSRRRSDFRKRPGRVTVTVDPPSAHERAEALLELWSWLDGKISDTERAALLGRN